MASNNWIRVDANLVQRKVTFRLADFLLEQKVTGPRHLLRVAAAGMLVTLWGKVSATCTEGSIADVPDLLIEDWVGWWGEPGAFARWVREKHAQPDGTINDWHEMNGLLEVKRSKDRDRKRAQREREKTRGGKAASSHADVTADETGQSRPGHGVTDGRTDGRTDTTPVGVVVSPKQPLPALRDRTKAGVVERLAEVTAEITSGTRNRLDKEQARKLAASVVFAYWQAKTGAGDRTLLDDQRERDLVKALRESGDNVSEMLYAVDGALKSDWHNGRKDGTKKFRIRHIFAHREMIEELANRIPSYRNGEQHPMVEKYAAALRGEENEAN